MQSVACHSVQLACNVVLILLSLLCRKLKTQHQVFHAFTDARMVRAAGIPVIGFSPMIHTPVLRTLNTNCHQS